MLGLNYVKSIQGEYVQDLLPYNYQLSKSIVHEIKFGDIADM